jgi:hypothetical protein
LELPAAPLVLVGEGERPRGRPCPSPEKKVTPAPRRPTPPPPKVKPPVVGHRAVYVIDDLRGICGCVGLRARYMVSAIVPVFFLQVVETSPYRRGSAEIFNLYYCVSSFAEKSPSEGTRSTLIVFISAAGLPAQRRLATAPTRHYPASLSPPPPYV